MSTPISKLLKLSQGNKILINDIQYTITKKSKYKTVEEYDDPKDYGSGIKWELGKEYYLTSERRNKRLNFLKITKKKGLIFFTETHLPISIKEIRILNKS
ncbi:MAG TPA: hypothetical protein VJA23_06365 [Candidatus Nanoarchaeia archaeon]|nr:hypothetical protein [Candidatus Nanoarchaeia archaeon]